MNDLRARKRFKYTLAHTHTRARAHTHTRKQKPLQKNIFYLYLLVLNGHDIYIRTIGTFFRNVDRNVSRVLPVSPRHVVGWVLDDDVGRAHWLSATPSRRRFIEMADIRQLERQAPVDANE